MKINQAHMEHQSKEHNIPIQCSKKTYLFFIVDRPLTTHNLTTMCLEGLDSIHSCLEDTHVVIYNSLIIKQICNVDCIVMGFIF